MNSKVRTDLALEAEALRPETAPAHGIPDGVRLSRRQQDGFRITVVEVLDARGEAALGKPVGRYVTLELDALLRREENAFPAAAALLAEQLRSLLKMEKTGSYLVVGLGNRDITPDAIGPEALEHIMVTRHLTEQLPVDFAAFRPVCALCSGVLGTTGMESSALVQAVSEKLHPSAVIVVDALASREPGRLCRTIQLADTGIVPGSGVGNARAALNASVLGAPVIAIGVPTVVDAGTLAMDLAAKAGAALDPDGFGAAGEMIVTPRDIDRSVRDISKLIGYGINLALHDGLTVEDVDMFLS